ncbi:hypothetical protein [Fredinandcohnia onubensis]|uniref:hypothetical protein n=1 Tax=Fredinandcohnia onubensis TaxID=1571209 RepID=UPI000C0BF4C9|nr:hypothetical protein [Fredinandcohnia onubensis]
MLIATKRVVNQQRRVRKECCLRQREWEISRGESEKSADWYKESGRSAQVSQNAVLIATKLWK